LVPGQGRAGRGVQARIIIEVHLNGGFLVTARRLTRRLLALPPGDLAARLEPAQRVELLEVCEALGERDPKVRLAREQALALEAAASWSVARAGEHIRELERGLIAGGSRPSYADGSELLALAEERQRERELLFLLREELS
jgi:hypothetical protein